MSIYRSSEIHGHEATELPPQSYRHWGRALGQGVGPGSKVVVGGDGRLSTPRLVAALTEGLEEVGVDVVKVGFLPTPMIHYARRRLRAAASIVVTGSYHPADENGLQWFLESGPPSRDSVAALARAVDDPPSPVEKEKRTSARSFDITFDYPAFLQESWVDGRGAELHVVLDTMHGAMSSRARRFLHAVFPRLMMTPIHDQPDPVFCGEQPHCHAAGALDEATAAVERERADFGAACDGDGQRLALIDGDGVVLTPDELAWLVLDSISGPLVGQTIVCDDVLSKRIGEHAKARGADVVVVPGRPCSMWQAMKQHDALVGLTYDGLFYERALDNEADALYTLCRLVDYAAVAGRSIAEMRKAAPSFFATPSLPLSVASEGRGQLVASTREAFGDSFRDEDGTMIVSLDKGTAVVHEFDGDGELAVRFEADNSEDLDELVGRFCHALGATGENVIARYERAMHYP